jgi:hypothetical protein
MTSTKHIMGRFVLCTALGACASTPGGADGPESTPDLSGAGDMTAAAAPAITAVSPAAASNTGGATITVDGTGFQPNATITVGGVAAAGATITPTRITFALPAKAATCGAAPIVVTNPDSQAATSNGFRYLTGSVGFQDVVAITTAATPRQVLVVDVDGDGKLDLVTANSGNSSATLRTGKGDGTFNDAVVVHSLAGTQPYAVATGDFTGDGKTDIVTVHNATNNLYVYPRSGATTFDAAKITAAGAGPYAVAVADFNKDGKLDVAVANNGSSNVSIRLGVGDGMFTSPNPANLGLTGTAPVALAVGDLNNDMSPDLVVAANTGNELTVYTGKGDGTFDRRADIADGLRPWGVTLADLNGDGKLDIAWVNNGGTTAAVRPGNGDGTFGATRTFTIPAGSRGIVAADLDGDGKLDLAVSGYTSGNATLLIGKGDGDFTKIEAAVALDTQQTSIAWGDLNGDGMADLIGSSQDKGTLQVRLGKCQ